MRRALFCVLLACGPEPGDTTATEGAPESCLPCVEHSDCPTGVCVAGECRQLCQADDAAACDGRPSECAPIIGGPLVCAC